MAKVDITSLSALIAEFKQLTARDSISPVSLGELLQRIVNLLATVEDFDSITPQLTELRGQMEQVRTSLAGYVHVTTFNALAHAHGADVKQLTESLATLATLATQLTDALAELERTGVRTPYFSGESVQVEDADIVMGSATQTGDALGADVVYDTNGRRFLLRFSGLYWANWTDAAQNYLSTDGFWRPKPGVLYRATEPPYGLWYFDEQSAHCVADRGNGSAEPDPSLLGKYALTRQEITSIIGSVE